MEPSHRFAEPDSLRLNDEGEVLTLPAVLGLYLVFEHANSRDQIIDL